MSDVVVIGDVQGCAETLRELLAHCESEFGEFRPVFVGDLINRGTRSLEVLQLVKEHDFECVLGNHELYVLAVFAKAFARKSDTLDELFNSPKYADWVDWLRHRPLSLQLGSNTVVHAGVHPNWSQSTFRELVGTLQDGLRSSRWTFFLQDIMGPRKKKGPLTDALAVLTRMRMLKSSGKLAHGFKGPPEKAPPNLRPWYVDYRGQVGRIFFGHWAALGARVESEVISLDTGCVWGRRLTGYNIQRESFVSVPLVGTDRQVSSIVE
ncbi:MAG: symmetrical bis(5'-nucleosyl)-tetraphosphatase [Bradymonadia bacterium]